MGLKFLVSSYILSFGMVQILIHCISALHTAMEKSECSLVFIPWRAMGFFCLDAYSILSLCVMLRKFSGMYVLIVAYQCSLLSCHFISLGQDLFFYYIFECYFLAHLSDPCLREHLVHNYYLPCNCFKFLGPLLQPAFHIIRCFWQSLFCVSALPTWVFTSVIFSYLLFPPP